MCPQVYEVYISNVYDRNIYIMISRSLSRWHSRSSAWLGSISNASATKGRSSAERIHTITIGANEAKTQELMQQRRMSHVEQLTT